MPQPPIHVHVNITESTYSLGWVAVDPNRSACPKEINTGWLPI